MTETKEVKPVSKLPISHIIILVFATILIFVWGYITRTMAGSKYWTVTGAWLPWVYILMLVAVLGRSGMKIDKTFLIAIFYALLMVTAKWYYFTGTSEVDYINQISGTLSSSLSMGVWPAEAKAVVGNLLPSWLVVSDTAAANRYYYGGGEPMWGAMMGPVVTWSIIFIVVAFASLSLSFFLMGPEFHDTEHLPFPINVPLVYVMNNTYTEETEGKKFGDIFTNIGGNRIFWVGAVIGIIINLPYVINQVLPAIPMGAYIGGGFGVYPMESVLPNITAVVQSVFPNATWITGSITLVCILIFMLVPFEVGTSSLFWTFLLGWIYPGVATRMGILAPGADVGSSFPIPLNYLWACGNEIPGSIGLGIIALYLMRSKIKGAISSFSKDFQVGGISMRTGMLIFLVSTVAFWVIWIAAGMDVVSTILMWAVFLVAWIGGVYHYVQLYWYMGACTAYDGWKWVQPISSGLGLLPSTANSSSTSAAAFGYNVCTMGSCVGIFNTNSMINGAVLTLTYQVGAATKADMRRLFIYLAVIIIVICPFSLFFDAWFNSHVGISNTSQSSMDMAWWNPASAAMDLGVRSITWSAGTLPILTQDAVMVVSTLILVASYFISTRFPVLGYVFNPIGMVTMGYGWSPWLTVLLGVICKFIINRIAGPRRAYEITIMLLSGIAVGFGLMFPIVGAYVWFSTGAPNLAALWK